MASVHSAKAAAPGSVRKLTCSALFVALAAGFIPSFDALGACIQYRAAFTTETT